MPTPDGTCGIRTHDPWVQSHGPLSTAPSVRTCLLLMIIAYIKHKPRVFYVRISYTWFCVALAMANMDFHSLPVSYRLYMTACKIGINGAIFHYMQLFLLFTCTIDYFKVILEKHRILVTDFGLANLNTKTT